MPHLNRIVTRPDAAQIARKLGGEMAPGTLRLAITALKSAWRWAVVENIVEINPWPNQTPATLSPPRARQQAPPTPPSSSHHRPLLDFQQ
jgi:hypothetical protein